MDIQEVIDLYIKERQYQTDTFGDYSKNPSLTLPSFLLFLKTYIDKAIDQYRKEWVRELPDWLENCKEFKLQGSAPVRVYEEVVKIFTLAGACLESNAEINYKEWRNNSESNSKIHYQNWKKNHFR